MSIILKDIKDTIQPVDGISGDPSIFGTNGLAASPSPDEFATLLLDTRFADGIPFKATYYSLILGVSGQCSATIGHHTFEVFPQTFSLISPQQICCYKDSSADFLAYALLFKKDFLLKSYVKDPVVEELLYIDPEHPPTYALTAGYQLSGVRGKVEDIDQEYKRQSAFYLNIIRLKIIELLYDYNRACEHCLLEFKKQMNRQYQLVYHFKKRVDEHFLSKKTVSEYASLFNISAKHLGEMVKEETGSTALEVIHNRILLEAQYLLKHSNTNIKEITGYLGFDTTSHFGRFFKGKTGLTPLAYRADR